MACGIDRIDRGGGRYAGTDEHMVRRRRGCGSDRCRISWTGLVTDPVIFAVSLLLLFFTRPIAVRYFNRDRVRTNVESMIGRQAIVTSEIDNLQGIGQVTVGGQEWSARTEEDGLNLQPGTVVDIVAVNGVKLIVKVDPQMAKSDGKLIRAAVVRIV